MSYTYYNGNFFDADTPILTAQDRSFRFGDGVFETILIRRTKPYQLETHFTRLQHGLTALQLSVDFGALHDAITSTIRKNNLINGTLRLVVSRGNGSRGYLPTGDTPNIVIECNQPPEAPDTPIRLSLSEWRVVPPACLPTHAKLNQGLNYTLARMEANTVGANDALMLSVNDLLAETSSASLFWHQNDIIYTPALSTGAVDGTMRAAIMRLSPVEVKQVEAPLHTLDTADGVFITNASMGVRVVETIDPINQRWKKTKLIADLMARYQDDIDDYCN